MLTVVFQYFVGLFTSTWRLRMNVYPGDHVFPTQVTALGAAVAAGVTAGVWKLGQKMGDITVYRWRLQIEQFWCWSYCKKRQIRLSNTTWAQVWNWRKGTGEENETVEDGSWEKSWLGPRGHEHRWLELSCFLFVSLFPIKFDNEHRCRALE